MESCSEAKQIAHKILLGCCRAGVGRRNLYKLYQTPLMELALTSEHVPEELREEVKQEVLTALKQIALM